MTGAESIVRSLPAEVVRSIRLTLVVAATLISHRFWLAPMAQQHAQQIHFAKNVAIFGGFLFVFVTGGGRFSLDRWWRPQKMNVAS